MSIFITLLILAYLLGSIPFGKLIGVLRGIDIQKKGSGNIGFANAVRVLGWPAGIAVLFLDTAKGFIPTIVALNYLSGWQVCIVGFVAILGHVFPVWLKFKGGKGIATGLGVSLAINPLLGAIGFGLYLLFFVYYKKSAPSSVVATWTMPIWSFFISPSLAVYYTGLALFATWTHRANLKQIFVHE